MNKPSLQEASSSVDEDPLPEPESVSPHSIYQHLERQAAASSFEVSRPGDPLNIVTECRMMPPQLFTMLEDQTESLRLIAGEQLSWFDGLDTPRTFVHFTCDAEQYVLHISDVNDHYLRTTFGGQTLSVETGVVSVGEANIVNRFESIALDNDERATVASELEAIGIELITIAQPYKPRARKVETVAKSLEPATSARRRFGGEILRKFTSR